MKIINAIILSAMVMLIVEGIAAVVLSPFMSKGFEMGFPPLITISFGSK